MSSTMGFFPDSSPAMNAVPFRREALRLDCKPNARSSISFLPLPLVLIYVLGANAQTESRAFFHNGYSRPYLIHRSAQLSPHPAVVFMLGGVGSTAKSASEDFNW